MLDEFTGTKTEITKQIWELGPGSDGNGLDLGLAIGLKSAHGLSFIVLT